MEPKNSFPPVERRKEPRTLAEGSVRLWFEGPEGAEIRGRLLDISSHGFRVEHRNAGLQAGLNLRFRHATAEGTARVMWNRVLPSRVESGFLVLNPTAEPRTKG